jgi:hypothetical protein
VLERGTGPVLRAGPALKAMDAGRRAAGWPAPPVVELRFEFEGAPGAGPAGLAGRFGRIEGDPTFIPLPEH